MSEGAEHRRNHAGQHICTQAITQAATIHGTADDLAHSQYVGRGFNQRHQNHDEHRDRGGQIEDRPAKVQRRGRCHDGAVEDIGKIRFAQGHRNKSTNHNGQQNGQAREHGTAKLAEQQHQKQR